jgi:hypothetical protein
VTGFRDETSLPLFADVSFSREWGSGARAISFIFGTVSQGLRG